MHKRKPRSSPATLPQASTSPLHQTKPRQSARRTKVIVFAIICCLLLVTGTLAQLGLLRRTSPVATTTATTATAMTTASFTPSSPSKEYIYAGGRLLATEEPSAASTASARFIGVDSSTQGNWRGVYGSNGHIIPGDSAVQPSYAQFSSSSNQWSLGDSTETRMLQRAVGTARVASYWYTNPVNFDINITDGQPHQIAIYFVDIWTYWNGEHRIEVMDAATDAVLVTQMVSQYASGKYMLFEVSGHVKIRLQSTSTDPNIHAMVNGVFFDPATPVNLARGKAVTQVSTGAGGLPEHAVDGNTSGDWEPVR